MGLAVLSAPASWAQTTPAGEPVQHVRASPEQRAFANSELAAFLTDQEGLVARVVEHELIVLARHPTGPIRLTGSFDADLAPVGDLSSNGLWGETFLIDDLQSAQLDLIALSGMEVVGYVRIRDGVIVPLEPPSLRVGSIWRGEMVGDLAFGVRTIEAYVPNAVSADTPLLLIIEGVASQEFSAAIDDLIADGELPPILVVMLGPAPLDVVEGRTLRGREFLRGLDDFAFARFETFVFQELLPFIRVTFRVQLDRADVAIAGASAAGAWVLSQSARNPDQAATWVALSLPPQPWVSELPRDGAGDIVLGAGTMEPDIMGPSQTLCAVVRDRSGVCRFVTVHGGHTQGVWQAAILRALDPLAE